MKMSLWWLGVASLLIGLSTLGIYVAVFNEFLLHVQYQDESRAEVTSLEVDLTIITNASDKGAVCLDGSPPAYHFHPGFGSGEDGWVVDLEGGAWCNDIRSCVDRKTTHLGSSNYMAKKTYFHGLLSNNPEINPDFYNWNRVRVCYCDGASFSGDSENQASQLQFRGQRIWSTVMEELMSKGMRNARQVLLTGCSAGGLASILHCDQFRKLFNRTTKVKCLSDAGLFLDVVDVSGGHSIRDLFSRVVGLRGVMGPSTCHLDPTLCFFPENLIDNITTPLFILNSAYDVWQIQNSLAPPRADLKGKWTDCKKDHAKCSASQIQSLQGFRNQMLKELEKFSSSRQNGLFINSCFAHCQSEQDDTWFAQGSPMIENKAIATSVRDWYFDRTSVDAIDCPYPCDKTCHNLVSK